MNVVARSYRRIHALVVIALMVIGISSDLFAQAGDVQLPMRLSFQGLLLRKDGTLFPDGTWNITAQLYDAESGGNSLYTTTIPVVVVKGVFNMIIGEIDPLNGVDFTKQLWLDIQAPDALPFSKRTQLTTAPYAFYSQNAVVAGGLSPDAKGAVLSVNGLEGRLNIRGTAGVTVVEDDNSNEIVIDATKMLDMIDLISGDEAVISIQRRKVIDSAGQERIIVEVSLKDSSISKKYLTTSDALYAGAAVSYDSTTISIPQYTLDRDGRVLAATVVKVPRRPDSFKPNRVLLTAPDGKMVESDTLGERQVVMGRQGGSPRVTTLKAGEGIQMVQNTNNELVISSDVSNQIPPIASGRYTNPGPGYVYETPDFDIRTATPVRFDNLKPTARIIVTMESGAAESTTAYTVTNRTDTGFRVKFAGGLPPGASISWMVLNL